MSRAVSGTSREARRRRWRRVAWIAALALLAMLSIPFWLPGLVEEHFNRVGSPGVRVEGHVRLLHQGLDVVDLHADTLLWHRDVLQRSSRGQVDLPRLVEGHVALQVFSVVTVAPGGATFARTGHEPDRAALLAVVQGRPPASWGSPLARALAQAEDLHRAVSRSHGRLVLIRTREDLDRLMRRRRAGEDVTGALLALEGLYPLEGRLDNVDLLFAAGFRMAGLAHFTDSDVAGSLHGPARGGLTPFGRKVVARMRELGMIVDLAHGSTAAFDDVAALGVPFLVSHAGVRATCDTPRNLSDDQLRTLASRGGLVGIAYFEGATCGHDAASIARAVSHAVTVAGVEHVALGSDFDGAVETPFDASGLACVTQALLDAGLPYDTLRAVEGANALRVLHDLLPAQPPR